MNPWNLETVSTHVMFWLDFIWGPRDQSPGMEHLLNFREFCTLLSRYGFPFCFGGCISAHGRVGQQSPAGCLPGPIVADGRVSCRGLKPSSKTTGLTASSTDELAGSDLGRRTEFRSADEQACQTPPGGHDHQADTGPRRRIASDIFNRRNLTLHLGENRSHVAPRLQQFWSIGFSSNGWRKASVYRLAS